MRTEDRDGKSGFRSSNVPESGEPLSILYSKSVPELPARHLSPLRLLVIIIAGIFLAEVFAMVVVYLLEPRPYIQVTLIDAGVMTLLITPLLYFLSFRPLLRYVQKSRQAEKALIRALDLQERFFDSIDTLIAYMDRDFNFIRVNEAYARSNEQQPEYFVGKNHFELFPHAENQAIFQRVVDTGEAFSVNEKPFEFPDKPEWGITYWNWSLLPVQGTDQQVEGVVLSLVDVTERVRAEAMNRQLSRIVEQTADTVVVTDCDGVIEYINPAFEQMTGYTITEAVENTPSVLKSGLHDDLFYKDLWETILSGKVFQSEIANRKKNGDLFYEVKTITPLRNELGDITHFVATGKDITEHKKAEEELRKAYDELELRVQARTEELRIANSELEAEIVERLKTEQAIKESEEKYRSLFNNMSEGFSLHEIIIDSEGKPSDYRFLELNEAFEELTGISRENALGKTIKEILPNIEPYWIETYGKTALTGEPIRYENYSADLGKWFESYCYSPRKNQFAVLFFDVTERRKNEEQVRYQATLLSNVNDAIIASDAQFCLTAWNTAAELVYGWKKEEVLGRNGLEITCTEWPGDDAQKIRKKIAETGRWRGEATQVRKDGTRFPVEMSSIVLYADDGQVAGYVSVNRDITERKQAEETVRQSQLDLDRAQEVGQIGSWRLDVRGNVLAWSDETYRIFSVPKGTPLTYESFLEFVYPDDRQYVDEQWNAALAGANYDIEHRVLIDGHMKWVREKAYLEFDDAGELMAGFGITQDITGRKLAEEALKRAHDNLEMRVRERTQELAIANLELQSEIYEREEVERQLRVRTTAMEAAANGIIITDPEGEILWTNPALMHMTGFSEEDLIGQNMSVFKSGQHNQDYYQTMWESINTGQVWRGEMINQRKDGSVYIEEQTITPVFDENDRVSYFIAIKQDITEHKRIESALELERTRLKSILDTIPDGVYIVNQEYEVEYANPVIEREFGSVDGRKCFAYFHDLETPCSWCMNEKVFSGIPMAGEHTYLKNNKSYEIFDAPLVNADGSISKLKLLHDITQRKKMEIDLERSNRDLQVASEAERKQRLLAEALAAAALILNKSLHLDEVLRVILDQIKQVIPYQLASIGLLEGDVFYDASHQGDLDLPASRAGIMKRSRLADFPLLEAMCQSGEPVLISNTALEPGWKTIETYEWCRSFLSAPLVVEKRVIGFVNLFTRESGFFTQEMSDRVMAFASHAAIAIQNAWLFEQVRSSSERLQSLSRRLVEIQENERLYIARELHDEAGQMLTSLLVDLRLMEKEASQSTAIMRIVNGMETSLNDVIENLHRIAMALRPASLDHVGLVAALRQHVEAVGAKQGLKASFDARSFSGRLPANVETVLYRIVQEALTNVIRHSHASQVDVILTVRKEKLVLIVEDDGAGFDPDAIQTDEHLGLFGMRERVEMIDGNLVIESAPGKGTTIMVEVDYANTNIDR